MNPHSIDIGIVPIVSEMMNNGIKIDVAYFQGLSKTYQERMENIQSTLDSTFGHHINCNSSDQIVRSLKELGIRVESADHDTIEPLALKNPVVRLIQDYKMLSKLKGTYIDKFPKMVDKNGRLHTKFGITKTETGRLDSSSPNLMNAPSRTPEGQAIRKGFIADLGYVLLRADYCVTGDTQVVTTDGHLPIKDIKPGIGVLSCINGKELSIQRVLNQACIGTAHVYEITTADGSTVKCTSDHTWMTYEGDLVETKHLKVGDRLSHVKTGMSGKYPTWYIRTHTNYIKKHIAVCAFVHGERPPDTHADHINADRHDWKASNLRWLTSKINYAQGGQRYWKAVKSKKRSDDNRLAALRNSMKQRSFVGDKNPNYGKHKGENIVCKTCGKVFYAAPSRRAIYCCRECAHLDGRNHRIVNIEYAGIEPVYQLTIENTHTYVLANGMVSGNSQIEMRLLACVSNDKVMLDLYAKGVDLHTYLASKIFKCKMEDVNKTQRKFAKNTNFMVGYGVTAQGLFNRLHSEGIDTSIPQCERFIESWFTEFKQAGEYFKSVHEFARNNGYVENWIGRRRWVPEVYSSIERISSAGIRQAGNFPIQSGAQEIIKIAMYKLYQEKAVYGDMWRALLQIHDELITEVREELVEDAKHILVNCMESSASFQLPFTVEPKKGINWLEMEVMK